MKSTKKDKVAMSIFAFFLFCMFFAFLFFSILFLGKLVMASEENLPIPVEVIQDDEQAYIVINSYGDREEHYFENGVEVKMITIDSRGNRFEIEYDEKGRVIREVMPDEIVGMDIHTEEQVVTETNEKGVVGVLHYDIKDRITKIEEQFVFGYTGVTEYEYYELMQQLERDGHRGYEWVVKKEISYLMKDGERKASIVKEFDKKRTVLNRETEGLTVMFPVISLIAKFYGYDVSEEDVDRS